MSQTNDFAPNDHDSELLERARARGARRMVLQGLTLYYQSLVHRVHEDSPSFFEDVLAQAQRNGRIRAH
jgi:hypothetical protein